jgi:hypothetical protein
LSTEKEANLVIEFLSAVTASASLDDISTSGEDSMINIF